MDYKVGDVFKQKKKYYAIEPGTLCVCYAKDFETLYFIFENGVLGSMDFNKKEMDIYLKKVGFSHAVSIYKYKNIATLKEHFAGGVFAPAFAPIFKQLT